jgi:hypothetical protein
MTAHDTGFGFTSSGLEHDLRAVVVLVLEHLIALGRILERKVV